MSNKQIEAMPLNIEQQLKGKRRLLLTLAQTLLTLALALLVICQSIVRCCFNLPFYEKNFHELQTAQKVDISEADLSEAIKVLFAYLQGERTDLNLTVQLTSTKTKVEMYNQREKAHMLDVRALFNLLLKLQSVLVGVVLILVCLLFWLYMLKYRQCLMADNLAATDLISSFSTFWQSFRKASLYSLFLILALVALIALLAWRDFDSFWWHFHELLFTNDLWQLDPTSSRMINLVEGQFFNNLVNYILQSTAKSLLLMYLCLLLFPTLCLRFLKKHRPKS